MAVFVIIMWHISERFEEVVRTFFDDMKVLPGGNLEGNPRLVL